MLLLADVELYGEKRFLNNQEDQHTTHDKRPTTYENHPMTHDKHWTTYDPDPLQSREN